MIAATVVTWAVASTHVMTYLSQFGQNYGLKNMMITKIVAAQLFKYAPLTDLGDADPGHRATTLMPIPSTATTTHQMIIITTNITTYKGTNAYNFPFTATTVEMNLKAIRVRTILGALTLMVMARVKTQNGVTKFQLDDW